MTSNATTKQVTWKVADVRFSLLVRVSAMAFSLLLIYATSYFSLATRSARRTGFHNRGTMAIITIHRSNSARSIANSMSAAKRIERNAIRFIMRVQVQEIRRTQPELLNGFVLLLLLPPSSE